MLEALGTLAHFVELIYGYSSRPMHSWGNGAHQSRPAHPHVFVHKFLSEQATDATLTYSTGLGGFTGVYVEGADGVDIWARHDQTGTVQFNHVAVA